MSKKYGGRKQGWGEGTPSHKAQRRTDRRITKSNQRQGKQGGKGCAVIIVGAVGFIASGVAVWKGLA